MKRIRVATLAIGLVMSAAVAGAGLATTPPNARAIVMKHVKRALRPLAEMKKSGSFDPTEASKRGQEIAGYLQQFKDLFPAGSEREDDQAKANIWTDRAGFETARGNAVAAALALAKTTDAASFETAYKALGAACTSCHDKYADLE